MLENEEPWHPPALQNLPLTPTINPQVPEITILSSESRNSNNKINNSNFFKQSNNKPSVTAVVPDLSILDAPKVSPSSSGHHRTTLTKSYKEMLINTHDEIIRSRSNENPSTPAVTASSTASLRQGLLSKASSQNYRPNPLCKYVPSKVPEAAVDGNSSSILNESSDNMQLKSVAGILSEIQKLVTPSKESRSSHENIPNDSEILQQLAKIYLTSEEYLSLAKEEFE